MTEKKRGADKIVMPVIEKILCENAASFGLTSNQIADMFGSVGKKK